MNMRAILFEQKTLNYRKVYYVTQRRRGYNVGQFQLLSGIHVKILHIKLCVPAVILISLTIVTGSQKLETLTTSLSKEYLVAQGTGLSSTDGQNVAPYKTRLLSCIQLDWKPTPTFHWKRLGWLSYMITEYENSDNYIILTINKQLRCESPRMIWTNDVKVCDRMPS